MNDTVTTIEISVKNMPEDFKTLFAELIDHMMAINNMNFTKNVKAITTMEISIENMPEYLKTLFLERIDRIMVKSNMNFTKNVKVETVEQIVSDMEAFNGKG